MYINTYEQDLPIIRSLMFMKNENIFFDQSFVDLDL